MWRESEEVFLLLSCSRMQYSTKNLELAGCLNGVGVTKPVIGRLKLGLPLRKGRIWIGGLVSRVQYEGLMGLCVSSAFYKCNRS